VNFEVLFVCTGNVCRSPTAELLFRAWADPRAAVTARSAGTRALVGAPIDTSTAVVLDDFGLDPTLHSGTQFEPRMAADAGLVLTAQRKHRDLIIGKIPSTFRRTFTMKEFARLVHAIPAGMAPRDVVATADEQRPVLGAVPIDDDDTPDPYRGDVTLARHIAEEVGTAVYAAVHALGFSTAALRAAQPDAAPQAANDPRMSGWGL
jgi:protein-tyrosine phosphatase